MVGYNPNMLRQKAREFGFKGENMADFPAYLEQNAGVAQQFLQEQNQNINNIPQFQTGGVLPKIPTVEPSADTSRTISPTQKQDFISAMGITNPVNPGATYGYNESVNRLYEQALKSHGQQTAQQTNQVLSQPTTQPPIPPVAPQPVAPTTQPFPRIAQTAFHRGVIDYSVAPPTQPSIPPVAPQPVAPTTQPQIPIATDPSILDRFGGRPKMTGQVSRDLSATERVPAIDPSIMDAWGGQRDGFSPLQPEIGTWLDLGGEGPSKSIQVTQEMYDRGFVGFHAPFGIPIARYDPAREKAYFDANPDKQRPDSPFENWLPLGEEILEDTTLPKTEPVIPPVPTWDSIYPTLPAPEYVQGPGGRGRVRYVGPDPSRPNHKLYDTMEQANWARNQDITRKHQAALQEHAKLYPQPTTEPTQVAEELPLNLNIEKPFRSIPTLFIGRSFFGSVIGPGTAPREPGVKLPTYTKPRNLTAEHIEQFPVEQLIRQSNDPTFGSNGVPSETTVQPEVGTAFSGMGQFGPQKPFTVTQEMYDKGFTGLVTSSEWPHVPDMGKSPAFIPEKFKQWAMSNPDLYAVNYEGSLMGKNKENTAADRGEQSRVYDPEGKVTGWADWYMPTEQDLKYLRISEQDKRVADLVLESGLSEEDIAAKGDVYHRKRKEIRDDLISKGEMVDLDPKYLPEEGSGISSEEETNILLEQFIQEAGVKHLWDLPEEQQNIIKQKWEEYEEGQAKWRLDLKRQRFEAYPEKLKEYFTANPSAAQYQRTQAPQGVGQDVGQGVPTTTGDAVTDAVGITEQRLVDPALPSGTKFEAAVTPFEQAQTIDPTTGQVSRDLSIAQAAQVPVAQTAAPATTQAAQIEAAQTTPAIQEAAIQAAQIGGPTQTIEAQQQTQTQVANLQAAQQAQATQIQAPSDRALQAAEQISGPTQQAVQAAAFVEPSLQAAQANPSLAATVQGQLAILSEQFVEGNVPFWAAGAIRTATQRLEARGLGASSMVGQSIVQAALEASFPIAQADARTIASFEAQNLTNRQQSAMLTGQYRAQFLNQEFDQAFQTRIRNAATISDIANRNFTADQQIALENAKFAQTVDLSNLSNEQALVMANASALSNLDISNLNNRQQAAVQNAQNFLQLDVSNLNNAQQAAVLNSQQQVQSILTDASAENTARQINATNQQQTDQFYANLIASIAQNNTAQTNAINQFNTGEVNAIQKFNSEITNQRDQFNARNQLAIEQSNAVWRREIATADTAAINFQNQFNAKNLLDISTEAYDNLWQEYRDIVEFAFVGAENKEDRFNLLQLAAINNKAQLNLQQFAEDRQDTRAIGGFINDLVSPVVSYGMSSLAEVLFGTAGTPSEADIKAGTPATEGWISSGINWLFDLF